MSRVGKHPITLPKGVTAQVAGQVVSVKGPKGQLQREVRREIAVVVDGDTIVATRNEETQEARAFHGMERALINNMVKGVSEGYEAILELNGVGYRADVKGKKVVLGLGFSHEIDFQLPEGVSASLLKEGRDVALKLESIDKQLIGQVAAKIRSLRPPEPYKGKGIRFRGEQVRRKAGKTGK